MKFCLISSLILASSLMAAESKEEFAIVNFTTCMTNSKHGKKEQENFEALRKQVVSTIEQTEKELKEIAQKLDDPDYLDTLSPKAEEELKIKYQSMGEDLARYQNQYYQILQHAQMQSMQKLNQSVSDAAARIAKDKNLSYVLNKELCFYYKPSLEITDLVIKEMNNKFDQEEKSLSLKNDKGDMIADNQEDLSLLDLEEEID